MIEKFGSGQKKKLKNLKAEFFVKRKKRWLEIAVDERERILRKEEETQKGSTTQRALLINSESIIQQ